MTLTAEILISAVFLGNLQYKKNWLYQMDDFVIIIQKIHETIRF